MKIQNAKFKMQNYSSKFKSYFTFTFLLVLLTFNFLLLTSDVVAADPTPTATASAGVKSKLKALQEEIASKAAQIKSQISKSLQNKAYVGYVKSKSTDTLTIATDTGSKIINVNQDTLYSGGKAKVSFKSLVVDDYIVSLGDIDESEVLTAKKIIKLTPTEFPEIVTIKGNVTSLSDHQFNIQPKDGDPKAVITDDKTVFKFGQDSATISDLRLNKAVIVVGTQRQSGTRARTVYIYPYTSAIDKKVTPTASPSATPTTTKKTTPTPTKKPTVTPKPTSP